MASKSTSSRTAASHLSSVRRNLFHHSLSRRPTNSTKASATASSATEDTTILDDSAEIVVKDRNGNYQVTVPTLPPMEEEQAQEEEEAREKEKMEARLLEMLKDKSIQPGEPLVPELLTAVQSSLRRKVASLAEDNWMYEADYGTNDG